MRARAAARERAAAAARARAYAALELTKLGGPRPGVRPRCTSGYDRDAIAEGCPCRRCVPVLAVELDRYPREEMTGLVAQLGHVAIICGVSAATFSRLITGPVTYLQYDDEKNYNDVAQLYSFSSESLRWVWEDGVVLGVWEPVALLFKMAWHVGTSGGGPAVCFAVNLALHTTNGVSVYLLLANSRRRNSAKAQEQWQLCVMLSTLGFAAHPLRCEVVCWASCQPYRTHTAL